MSSGVFSEWNSKVQSHLFLGRQCIQSNNGFPNLLRHGPPEAILKLGSMNHKVVTELPPSLSPYFRDKFLAFTVLHYAVVLINLNLIIYFWCLIYFCREVIVSKLRWFRTRHLAFQWRHMSSHSMLWEREFWCKSISGTCYVVRQRTKCDRFNGTRILLEGVTDSTPPPLLKFLLLHKKYFPFLFRKSNFCGERTEVHISIFLNAFCLPFCIFSLVFTRIYYKTTKLITS